MEAKRYFQQHKNQLLDQAKAYLAIRSISTQPQFKSEIRKTIDWLVNYFEDLELETEVWPSPGHPYVFASTRIDPGKPTVLIYGHYDVQPPEPLKDWKTPPFTPTVKKGAIFARGATDNKIQHLIYLFALASLMKEPTTVCRFVNVKFIIEGEEEIGSPSTVKVLPKYKEKLKADFVLVSDGPMVAKGLPTIIVGTRGLLYTELLIETGKKDLHSGLFGGGVENPANLLAWVITKIKDRQGKISIPGFYDKVLPLEGKEKELYENFPIREEDFRKNANVKKIFPEEGYSVFAATRARPAMDVNGIWGGYIQPGTKTIIPNKATAKISFRLVPKQDPEKIFLLLEKYLQKIIPPTAEFRLTKDVILRPYVWGGNRRWLDLGQKILKTVWEQEPIVVREGGSIGILDFFKRSLGMDSLLVNFGSPDDNLHAPNEKFDLENLEKAFLFAVKFLSSSP